MSSLISQEAHNEDIAAPVEAAKAAGLRYVSDATPGIQRKRAGKHFSYLNLNGSLLKALQRDDEQAVIEALNGLHPEEIAVLAFLEQK